MFSPPTIRRLNPDALAFPIEIVTLTDLIADAERDYPPSPDDDSEWSALWAESGAYSAD